MLVYLYLIFVLWYSIVVEFRRIYEAVIAARNATIRMMRHFSSKG